jgi:hypothetical protein
MGIKLDTGFWLTKDQVKDIVELNFSPGGVIGLLSNADSGFSNLGCLPRTFAEIAAIKQFEAKEEQAKDNMTITDLNKKEMARGKRVPPTSWDGLQRNVGTTLGMVAITCGERSNIYAKLHEVHMVLQGGYVSAIEGWAYTAQKCRQYTWALYEAIREYFGVELTPEKFGPRVQFVNYPRLLVDNLIEKMREGDLMYKATYPAAWRTLDAGGTTTTQTDSKGGAQVSMQTTTRGTGGYLGQQGESKEREGKWSNTKGGQAGGVEHVHPKIAKMMKPVWEKHGKKIGISSLTGAAGISNRQLPYIRQYMEADGRNCLCYTHLVGECHWAKECGFIHVPEKELEDPFVDELVTKLTPGANYMVTQAVGTYPGRSPDRVQSGGRGGRGGGGRGGSAKAPRLR